MLTKRQQQILNYLKRFIRDNDYIPSVRKIAKHFRLSSPSTIQQHIEALRAKGYLDKNNQPQLIQISENKKSSDLIQIPLLGTIAAGQPIEAIENPETITIPKTMLAKPGKHFALRVEGNSMIDEGIFDSDIIIIRKQPTAENGEMVVALLDENEVTLKKLFKVKGGFKLQPANPTFKPIFVKELLVQGKVISIIRNFENQLVIDKKFTKVIERPLENRTVSKMYQTHKYWARKPWYVVSEYIKFFTKPGDIVLDNFAGSGVTGIESIILNRVAYLIDLNPVASFVSKMTALSPVNTEKLLESFEYVKEEAKDKINKFYQTQKKCEICGNYLVGRHFNRGPKFENILVKENCIHCERSKNKKRALTGYELSNLKSLEKKKIKYWYPRVKFPVKFDKDRLTYKGIKNVHQLFTRRNLLAISFLYSKINKVENKMSRELMKLAFSNTLLHVSKLKAENVRPLAVNNYWVPDDWIEENVWFRFEDRFKRILQAKKISNDRIKKHQFKNLHIYTKSATDLGFLENNSVDYCFNDPPYGDSIQYSELSIVWNAWLNKKFSPEKEIIINRSQNKGINDYKELLTEAYKEVFRVLKSGGYTTVCFHNKNFSVWLAILQACKDAGFLYINVVPQNPISKSFTQLWAKNSPKTDLLMNFMKPRGNKLELKNSNPKEVSLDQLIREAVNYLNKNNKPIKVDLVYDYILSKLAQEEFYNGLSIDYNKCSIKEVRKLVQAYATS